MALDLLSHFLFPRRWSVCDGLLAMSLDFIRQGLPPDLSAIRTMSSTYGSYTSLRIGPQPTEGETLSGASNRQPGATVKVDEGVHRITFGQNSMQHEHKPVVEATSGDLHRMRQSLNPSSLVATVRTPGGRGRVPSEVQPTDRVNVGGVEMEVRQAEALGLLVKSSAGGYTDAF